MGESGCWRTVRRADLARATFELDETVKGFCDMSGLITKPHFKNMTAFGMLPGDSARNVPDKVMAEFFKDDNMYVLDSKYFRALMGTKRWKCTLFPDRNTRNDNRMLINGKTRKDIKDPIIEITGFPCA